VALGVKLAVEWAHDLETEMVTLFLGLDESCLLALEAGLQLGIVDAVWVIVKTDDLLCTPDQEADPDGIGWLLSCGRLPSARKGFLTGLTDLPGVIVVGSNPKSGFPIRGHDVRQAQPGKLVGGQDAVLTCRDQGLETCYFPAGSLQSHLLSRGEVAQMQALWVEQG
jgi:hypothetical protein